MSLLQITELQEYFFGNSCGPYHYGPGLCGLILYPNGNEKWLNQQMDSVTSQVSYNGPIINKVRELVKKQNKIEICTKYQLESINGTEHIKSINIKHDDKSIKEIKTDYVLGFFGLIMQLGPISDWGLNLDKKTIPVNTESFETNKEGIFAIGDICTYPGKLKLILSGFHEGALAARGCFKYAKPDEKYRFEFTTASKTVKERLGVKK